MEKEVLCTCPKCGKNVVETEKAYSCEDWKECGFAIWKDNRYFQAIGFEPTKEEIVQLINGETIFVEGLTSKRTGNTFDAYLKMGSVNGKYPEWKMKFPDKEED